MFESCLSVGWMASIHRLQPSVWPCLDVPLMVPFSEQTRRRTRHQKTFPRLHASERLPTWTLLVPCRYILLVLKASMNGKLEKTSTFRLSKCENFQRKILFASFNPFRTRLFLHAKFNIILESGITRDNEKSSTLLAYSYQWGVNTH